MRACADDREAEMVLGREIPNALDEVATFPERVTDPGWMTKLEKQPRSR